MIRFPTSKINLGLRVIARRADGYHDIETIFFPIALKEATELIVQQDPKADAGSFELIASGIPIPGDPDKNLCRSAYTLIKKDFPSLPPLTMFLHKAIPIGAGLGGGSSDGTATLLLINDLLKLHLSAAELEAYALQLGSDCPFFVANIPCLATGRGEIMTPIQVDLAGHFIVLVDAGIHVKTSWAFAQVTPQPQQIPLQQLILQPITGWKDFIVNDFEHPVFQSYPGLPEIKETLYRSGAVYASMTGTGSAIYGIFPESVKLELDVLELQYKVYTLR